MIVGIEVGQVEREVRMNRLTVKRIALILGSLFVVAIGALAAFLASEWTYISRMRSRPANSILDVAWYQPKEAVPGVEHPAPFPVEDGLAPDAFAEAAKLAESKNAAALAGRSQWQRRPGPALGRLQAR